MSIYTIKKVPRNELEKLRLFLDCHWQKGHALVKSFRLLDFQHYSGNDDCYNFLVAENMGTRKYDALIGYIPLSQYDYSLAENGNYWGAIWKTREDVDNEEISSIGFLLWKKMFKLPNFHSYAAIGISDIARRIYVASRLNVDVLSQYYLLNDRISSFNIAGNVSLENMHREQVGCDTHSVRWVDNDELDTLDVAPYYRPYKSIVYFKNRYANHPIYKYRFLGVYGSDSIISLWAVRKIAVENSCVIRIVDVLGKLEGNVRNGLLEILYTENAEYFDFYNYGIDENVFQTLGFNKLDSKGELIIPNYFEPFVQANVTIGIGYKADFDYVAFKGDSDQDRPNIIND